MDENELSHQIIGAAIEVHRTLGPGLLESIYEGALAIELADRGMVVQRQVVLPVTYKGHALEGGFRIDLVVEDLVVVEVKAVETLLSVHEAQLLTYLRLSTKKLGLLMNFNSTMVGSAIRRVVNNL
jgi:GxxExxY protein